MRFGRRVGRVQRQGSGQAVRQGGREGRVERAPLQAVSLIRHSCAVLCSVLCFFIPGFMWRFIRFMLRSERVGQLSWRNGRHKSFTRLLYGPHPKTAMLRGRGAARQAAGAAWGRWDSRQGGGIERQGEAGSGDPSLLGLCPERRIYRLKYKCHREGIYEKEINEKSLVSHE